jgi:hypothetical protein
MKSSLAQFEKKAKMRKQFLRVRPKPCHPDPAVDHHSRPTRRFSPYRAPTPDAHVLPYFTDTDPSSQLSRWPPLLTVRRPCLDPPPVHLHLATTEPDPLPFPPFPFLCFGARDAAEHPHLLLHTCGRFLPVEHHRSPPIHSSLSFVRSTAPERRRPCRNSSKPHRRSPSSVRTISKRCFSISLQFGRLLTPYSLSPCA